MNANDSMAKVVGKDNVSSQPAVLDEYTRDISFVDSISPACVVRPSSADEVKGIVKLANETLTPLVPVSSGPPHFKGDTIPGAGGAIIVDMSGMKKIIRVDRPSRMAMFEPGVTFGELIPAVKKAGLRLNMPLLPRKSKSVVGSLLEREPVVMPVYAWDIFDPMSCVEIVFGNGEVFRTGAAAGPGTIEDQWAAGQSQNEAAGPSQASFHTLIQGAQGTMGIVTWASARCEILPSLEEPFLAGSSDIEKILELQHWLLRLRLVNECFVLNNTNLATILAGHGTGDYQAIKDSLPRWLLFFNIVGYDYLPERRIAYRVNDMLARAQHAGVEPVKEIGRASAFELLEIVQGPSREPYWKLRRKGACEDIFFLGKFDKIPATIKNMYAMAEAVEYPVADMGVYFQPVSQGTNCHCEFNLPYDPDNAIETDRVKHLASGAVRRLLNDGAFFSRPYGESSALVYSRDVATVNALRKIKAVFDPNNIMNPGKLCF